MTASLRLAVLHQLLTADTGVPQGSILSPPLFLLFTTPLSDVISRFGVKFHQYIDDTQIYLAVNNDNCSKAVLNLDSCTDAVYEQLLHNSLALNPNKSKVAMFGTAQRVGALKNSVSVVTAGAPITLFNHVKSLSITFDSRPSFDKHVINICWVCYVHIQGLRQVCAAVSKDIANTITCATVCSQLD